MFRRILALVTLTSCGAYTSPSGELVVTTLDHEKVVAVDTGARDIPCEAGNVTVVTWVAPTRSSKDCMCSPRPVLTAGAA
jgi:hypothetical protein